MRRLFPLPKRLNLSYGKKLTLFDVSLPIRSGNQAYVAVGG
jgi:hypothetical protein